MESVNYACNRKFETPADFTKKNFFLFYQLITIGEIETCLTQVVTSIYPMLLQIL